MTKYLFILLLVSLSVTAAAQISGISDSKVGAISADVVPVGVLEFGPSFSTSRTASEWSSDGLNKMDKTSTSSSVNWGLTFGLAKSIEIGVSMPADFSSASWGLKSTLITKDVFSFAAMVGVTMPFGNRTFDPDNRSIDDLSLYGIGLITSWNFTEQSSVDFSIQYQDYFKSIGAESPGGLFINLDYGHYVADGKLLLILGTGYQQTDNMNLATHVFSVSPGISIEYSDKYLILLNTQHDLLGKNISKSVGFNIGLTTVW